MEEKEKNVGFVQGTKLIVRTPPPGEGTPRGGGGGGLTINTGGEVVH